MFRCIVRENEPQLLTSEFLYERAPSVYRYTAVLWAMTVRESDALSSAEVDLPAQTRYLSRARIK